MMAKGNGTTEALKDNALVPQQQGNAALDIAGRVEVFDDRYQDNDFLIPRIRVVQPTSKDEDAKGGDLKNSLTGDNYGTWLYAVIIKPSLSRLLFSKNLAEGLMCRSFDAVEGVGEPGGSCARCPMAQWNGKQAPECSLVYNYLSLVIESESGLTSEGMPVALGLTKTSAAEGKRLNTLLRYSRVPWQRVYKVKTQKVSNEKGVFFVQKVEPVSNMPVPEDAAGYAASIFEALRGQVVRIEGDETLHEDDASGSGARGGAPVPEEDPFA